MADLPYPIDDTRTHWEGCYRTPRHHNCAVVEVDRLRAENERLRKALEDARRFVDSSDCSCVIDTMNIAEHTPDCPVQAMAVRLDDALEATDA